MLQIRLSRGPSAESGGGTKSLPVETVTVACPDHLVLADLPVAKSLGSVTAGSLVKTVGRRSRRHLGERVHFCVRCDFPIAIYGRLSPCEHAFCLDCARSDSICYLCDERIQKIQTIKMMEGIFICAAPHCLKSFLKKTEFESHIHENHANLLQPNVEKDDANESEAQSGIKQPTASESSVKASMRPAFSPSTHSQPQRSQPREPPLPRPITQSRPSPHFGQGQNQPSEEQAGDSRPPGFERRVGAQNRIPQQAVDMQGGLQQEPADKQQDLSSDTQFPSFPPQHPQQPPNFGVPINSNPPFSYPTFPPEGVQPFYPESGSGQGSLLGFPPGPVASPNFPESYQRPWNAGPTGLPLETPLNGQGTADASLNSADSQRGGFFQGDYGRSPGGFPMNPSSSSLLDKGMERQGSNIMDPQSSTLPPPPPLPPPQASQIRGKAYSGDMGRDGPGYGWQHERRDSFGTGHD